jgi:hypothetical protein
VIKIKGLRVEGASLAPHLPTDTRQSDPDLGLINERWKALPEPIRAAILALVQAAGIGESQ